MKEINKLNKIGQPERLSEEDINPYLHEESSINDYYNINFIPSRLKRNINNNNHVGLNEDNNSYFRD